MKQLYPHQEAAIDKLRSALKAGWKRPVLQAPTGFGKTIVAASIIQSAMAKGKRVIITVPALSLVDQTVAEFYEAGITDIGVIQGEHVLTDFTKPVQVASVQTLQRRVIPKADLVIIDECHRVSSLYKRWFAEEDWLSVPIIGFSATPWSRGLGRLFDNLIVAATTKDLIAQGFLSPFKVFAPSNPDLSSVRTENGDFNEGDLSRVMDNRTLTGDIVDTWKRLGEHRPTFCFCVDRAHGHNMEERFLEAGVRAEYIDGDTPETDRAGIRRRFHSGQTEVVVNIGVLTTGIDWDVRAIILARPTKSEILYTQILGRGLRTAPGKTDLLILDHSNSTEMLGFVTDIHHTRLSEGRFSAEGNVVDKKTPLPKPCPQCKRLKPPSTPVCPSCGYKTEIASNVISLPGDLVELDEFKMTKEAERRNRTEDWDEKRNFIMQIRAYALDYNKSDGWVAHKYRDRYGVWPNDPYVRSAPAADECGLEVRSWIKAMNQRWIQKQERKRKLEEKMARRA